LKQKAKVSRDANDVPEVGVSHKTEDANPMNLDDETTYSENFGGMIFEPEDSEGNESLFDTNSDFPISEKTSDAEDDIESMFENEHEDNQNLIEEEFDRSSSSENYENFWDEEDTQFLFGIKDNPTKTVFMDICNNYTAESSKCEEFDSLENDIDLLDFGTLDEDMHDYSSADNFEESPSFTKRCISNNLVTMLPYSQPRSPFRDKTNTLFQGQEIYDSEKNQASEDTFFDTML
jgi:hypothetical protein